MPSGPPPGAHPRVLLAAAADRIGAPAVTAWCARLIRGEQRPEDPDLAWLGGTEDWDEYWRRVWGARGLLHLWPADDAGAGDATDAVEAALADPHWRVREMGLKVVRAHGLETLTGEVAALREDPNARVRSAAERALAALAARGERPDRLRP